MARPVERSRAVVGHAHREEAALHAVAVRLPFARLLHRLERDRRQRRQRIVPAAAADPRPEPSDSAEEEPVEAATPVESDWGDAVKEPAPDWDARYDYWFEQYSNRFVPPRVGLYVKVQTKEGRNYQGTLRNLDPDAMTLQIPNGQMRLEKARLTEETCRRFFQIDFARYHARRKVIDEREAYDAG